MTKAQVEYCLSQLGVSEDEMLTFEDTPLRYITFGKSSNIPVNPKRTIFKFNSETELVEIYPCINEDGKEIIYLADADNNRIVDYYTYDIITYFVNGQISSESNSSGGVSDSSIASIYINGTTINYSSTAELISAISSLGSKATATITLYEDIETEVDISEDQTITIDLNGNNLSTTSSGYAINNAGTLTIKDSAKSGTISSNLDNYCIYNTGDLTIDYATIVSSSTAASMIDNYGTLTINDGEYNGGLNTIKNEPDGTLIINGGVYSNSTQLIVLAYGDVTINGGTFTTTSIYCVKVGNSGTVGSLIVNGGSITASSAYAIYVACGSTLEVTGGSITGKYGIYAIEESTISVSDGEITATGAYGIYLNKCSLTTTGGEVSATTGAVFMVCNSTSNIKGGTFTGKYAIVLSVLLIAEMGNDFTYKSGILQGTTADIKVGCGTLDMNNKTEDSNGDEITYEYSATVRVGDNSYYTKPAYAVTNIADNIETTVYFISDVTLTGKASAITISENQKVIFDLGGYTLKSNKAVADTAQIINNGTLTITNGSIVRADATVGNYTLISNKDLTIDSSVIITDNATADYEIIEVAAGSASIPSDYELMVKVIDGASVNYA